MPELPEVETVRRSLAARLEGLQVSGLEIFFPGCIDGDTPASLRSKLVGKRVVRCERRAKYLVFALDAGECFVVHLRMTGRLTVLPQAEAVRGAHTRLVVYFCGGDALRFDDQRKFGRVMWLPGTDALKERVRVGPEPIDDSFGVEDLKAILRGRRRPIKSLLLDQRLIGGLGNIYADESLFRAGILPWRPVDSLKGVEVAALWRGMREVLQEGLRYRGATLRDYVDSDGREGEFQERLQVYGREGGACPRCDGVIDRVKLGGRSSFHCPGCQR